MNRFKVKCLDGQWRYVFCRSVNNCSKLTGNSIIPTEDKRKAYRETPEHADNTLNYFSRFAGIGNVKIA